MATPSRPARGNLLGATAVSLALCAFAVFSYGRFREAQRTVEARRSAVETLRQQNTTLAHSAALIKNTRFRIKAETPGTVLAIGAVHLDEAGKPQVFQTAACADWLGERYSNGSLDLSVSTRECSWAGQVAFYVLQFQSAHPLYPKPITLLGSWSNPTHVSDNVVRLP